MSMLRRQFLNQTRSYGNRFMRWPFASEARPFLLTILLVGGFVSFLAGKGLGSDAGWTAAVCTAVLVGFILFFFRDPEREIAGGIDQFVSGADGVVRAVEELDESNFLNTRTVRISVFLSVFNVHINRTPMAGEVKDLRHTPGKRLFAFLDAASEYNEHNSILVEGEKTRCLVRQIVGPVAPRVVCWKRPGERVERGQRIGIMKFGSRLDVSFPCEDVEIKVKKGDRVVAGKTVIATLKAKTGS